MAALNNWIDPKPFGDVRSPTLFFGWRGFQLMKIHNEEFKRRLFWVFSLSMLAERFVTEGFIVSLSRRPR